MEVHTAPDGVTESPTGMSPQVTPRGGSDPTLDEPPTSVQQLPPKIHVVYGRLREEKVYTVMSPDYDTPCLILVNMHWYSSSFTMKMLNGDSPSTGVSATARGKVGSFFGHDFLEVTLPALSPTQTSGTKSTMKCHRTSFRRSLSEFDLIIGGKEECFEWRKTIDAEATALGESLHRKLVRKSGPKSGTGNSEMPPQAGFKGDGEEIVAFMADNSRWNTGRSLTLHFVGSGLEGTLGENWKSAALLSGLWLWWMDLLWYGSLTAGGAVIATAGITVIAGVAP
ncbi:hypothetical protein LZ30DRAFT_750899 [Colletotrichum cereale]|nr:hypothetical protein LZ30DRAFT_750899 [Colletotrichum cereale]